MREGVFILFLIIVLASSGCVDSVEETEQSNITSEEGTITEDKIEGEINEEGDGIEEKALEEEIDEGEKFGDHEVEEEKDEEDGLNDIFSGMMEEIKDTYIGMNSEPCGEEYVFFSFSPVKLSELESITPLGNLNPSAHTFPTQHLYLRTVKNGATLYAPGDITINRISFSEHLEDLESSDYSIEFTTCKEFRGYFYHVKEIPQKLKNQIEGSHSWCNEYTTGGEDYRLCSYDVEVEVEAGEEIGTVGQVFDFGARDSRTPELDYVNKDRIRNDSLHVVCGLDYFEEGIKEELKWKLGNYMGKRTVEPICGEVEQDEEGTVQGIWFHEGHKKHDSEDKNIALVHDNFDPTIGVFSVGISVETIPSGIYQFTPKNSGSINRDFNQIKDEEIYCYETHDRFEEGDISKIILIQLKNSKLKIEGKNLDRCNENLIFSYKYSEFER